MSTCFMVVHDALGLHCVHCSRDATLRPYAAILSDFVLHKMEDHLHWDYMLQFCQILCYTRWKIIYTETICCNSIRFCVTRDGRSFILRPYAAILSDFVIHEMEDHLHWDHMLQFCQILCYTRWKIICYRLTTLLCLFFYIITLGLFVLVRSIALIQRVCVISKHDEAGVHCTFHL